ncbi:MAG: ATP-binding cassette domain-containing protein [Bacteroidia bacterium]|nr:ATP-binding cassette domain-containing protein [Bacteroidia bacterium]HQV00634.1 ATP-binding cassette domain-containing protein [Bacteroidia bacterium]
MKYLRIEQLRIEYQSGFNSPIFNLKIEKGQWLLLSGSSGSGKTTLAKAIMHLLPPDAQVTGSIFLDNIDLLLPTQIDNVLKRGIIRYMPQNTGLFFNPYKNAFTQLFDAVNIYNKTHALHKTREILEVVQLPFLIEKKKHAFQLSGGEQQRLLLALSLASAPELLIIDEPTASVDRKLKTQLIELIKSLQQQLGITILSISHEEDLYKPLVNRHYKIEDGCIIPYQQTITKPVLKLNNKDAKREIVLSCTNINYSFKAPTKQFLLLNDVSLQLFSNSITGLSGASGAGKSTLAKILNKTLEPDSGRIFLCNNEINGNNKSAQKKFQKQVQLLMQDALASLNPKHTLEQILLAPLLYHKIYFGKEEARSQISKWLHLLHLSDTVLQNYPHQLSMGQLQRMLFVRNFTLKPLITIVDECFTALDEANKQLIINAMKLYIMQNGASCLLISHDYNLLQQVCNYRYDIADGVLQPVGT